MQLRHVWVFPGWGCFTAAHRAQDVAADLDLKGLQRLRQLARRSGHSNARLEGVLDHFESLKEDIERCGPM